MRKSYILALALLVAVGVWLYSGSVVIGGRGDDSPSIAEQQAADGKQTALRVSIRRLVAQERQTQLLLRGRTEAEDRVEVRAETDGVIEDLAVAKGDSVKAGDILCRLDTRTRKAQLAQAEAQLAQADADHEAAARLAQNGYAAETRVRTLKAARDAAVALVEAAKWDIARTEIRAPIAGIVETLDVREGSLLRAGDICAGLVDIDPMLAVAQASERELAGLNTGTTALVQPVTGGDFTGTVSFIAPAADAATRTFRVEITLDNAKGRLRDGITSAIAIPLQAVRAHKLAPSALVLRDDGVVGVRAVGADNKVVFHPATIIGDDPDGVWVSGLPEEFGLIVRGQDYVVEGALVDPVVETAEAGQ